MSYCNARCSLSAILDEGQVMLLTDIVPVPSL